MNTIFDLPAHPLLVHFPVVAIPVLAIIAIVMVLRPSFRDRYGMAAIILGIITSVATILAASSGQALSEEFNFTDDAIGTHRSLGEALRIMVIGLTVALIGLVVAARRSSSTGRDPFSIFTRLAVVVLAVLSAIWVVRTGHEGAKSVWSF